LGACTRRDAKTFIARPTIGIQEYLLEPRQVFETSALIPTALKDDFLNATDKLIAAVKTCWRDDIPSCACMVIVMPVIFSGAMARCLSI
jgi:Ser/Thr protein kinase RdoA (MazF antagonist)